MGMSPTEFWSLTPDEWYHKLTGWKDYQKDMMKMSRVTAWYSGYYSQVSLQKAGLKSAIESTMSQEELDDLRKSEMDEGKALWQDSMKTSGKRRLK